MEAGRVGKAAETMREEEAKLRSRVHSAGAEIETLTQRKSSVEQVLLDHGERVSEARGHVATAEAKSAAERKAFIQTADELVSKLLACRTQLRPGLSLAQLLQRHHPSLV